MEKKNTQHVRFSNLPSPHLIPTFVFASISFALPRSSSPYLFLAPSFILCFLLSVSLSFIFPPSLPWKNHSEHNRHKTRIQSRAASPPHTHKVSLNLMMRTQSAESSVLVSAILLYLNCYFTFLFKTVHTHARNPRPCVSLVDLKLL